MPNFKLKGTKIRTERKGTETRQILETTLEEKIQICKLCKKEPRAQASSRCEKCSKNFKTFQNTQVRLQHRIDAQAKLSK